MRTFSARASYEIAAGTHLDVDLFNLTNAKVSDIDYFYTSRLQGEPAVGVDDVHSHPIEPRSVRIGISRRF